MPIFRPPEKHKGEVQKLPQTFVMPVSSWALDTAIWSINEIRTAWQEAGRAATRPES